MCLRFAAEYLHFILIQTLVGAELELSSAIIEVDIADGIADVLAKVARLGALE